MNHITIGQLKEFYSNLEKNKTIGEWRKIIKQFASDNKITGKEALDIACKRF